jgi:hypothetical protein
MAWALWTVSKYEKGAGYGAVGVKISWCGEQVNIEVN